MRKFNSVLDAILLTVSLLAIGLLAATPVAADTDWRLQPLKYNHPNLKVDLGVGLWAWPLPLDYDGDGDLDLLVSSPDKPSNGVYFFENQTQDPRVKLPVFKAGVRLGPAERNMQLSYVAGKPRLLREGFEYPNFRAGDFTTQKQIYANPNFHWGSSRAKMWRYVDYDGDGDQDLVVGIGDWADYGWDHAYDSQGEWQNGPLHGYVYLIENCGSAAAPDFSVEPRRLRAGGGEIDVYGRPSPNFADFDLDGDLDLLCGEFLDGFTYFENIGSRTAPEYGAGSKLRNDQDEPLVMDLQMITPTAIDWDGDNDVDLIVGDEDGRVALIENTGHHRAGRPIFKDPVYFQQQADTLKFGALVTPAAYDWDGDGDQDILCGNTAGYIGLIENLGIGQQRKAGKGVLPQWGAPKYLQIDGRPFRIQAGRNGSIQGPCEAKWGYTTLSVADWDGDNDPDIVFNSIWAKIGMLKSQAGKLVEAELNTGVRELPPRWNWWTTESNAALSQWRTTPVAIDFDGDRKVDIVALDQEGFLTVRPHGGAARRLFVDEDNVPIRLAHKSAGRSGRRKLAVVDWDQDGRLDLLVNSENATWYRNCEDRDGKIVLKRVGNLARRNVAGHTSSPAVCDFDQDGKPDLLVGAEDGRIYHIAHDDCIAYTQQQRSARPPNDRPTPEFPGYVSSGFVFTKAKFPQCHASTLCETTRGVVVAWFGGTEEKAKDVGIWVSYHDGGDWSTPHEWANGIQHEDLRHPCWNPVLYQPPGDGPTHLYFKVGPNPSQWWGEWMVSYDRGRTFGERRRLPEGIDGPVRCKPILLPDEKTLLCGSSTEYDGWRVHFEKITLSGGRHAGNWKRVGPINTGKTFNAIQPTFLQHADGKLQVLCRTRESVVTTSYSEDGGETWSKMEATNLPNPNSGIDVVTLEDGRHLLIYNHLGAGETGWGRRGLLNLAISHDGQEWRKVAILEQEEGAEFSYPAIIQAADGLVHMTYTWKRQRIKHVVVDPARIEVGPVLSLQNWQEGE